MRGIPQLEECGRLASLRVSSSSETFFGGFVSSPREWQCLYLIHASTIRDSAVSSTTPYYNRFSCCHGADDAYARIYGYFKRELARVSVRAAMLVRLRALDVVLGRSPRPESSMDRKEAKRAKATRLAAVDVVSESGIPADRGSFGA